MEEEPSSTMPDYDPSINQDDLILQRHKEIEKEISESISLVGEKEDLYSLEMEYFTDEVYRAKVRDLQNNYTYIRRTRPDGNCFYRAFGYAYFENLLRNKSDCQSVKVVAEEKKLLLISLGFSPITLEDFHEAFMEAIEIVSNNKSGDEDVHRIFNDSAFSDYVVVYLRLLTSGELQCNAEFYQNFIEGDRTVADFCHQEVEPMFKESDHIHVIALSTTLKVGTRVRYMDRGESMQTIAHDFPDGYPVSIHLLYRPGHYDILYSKTTDEVSTSTIDE